MFAALLYESTQNEGCTSTHPTPVPGYENDMEQMVYDGFSV
jgi:hypothetical protein